MSGLILTLALVAAYVSGWFVTAVVATRRLSTLRPYCHGEGRYGSNSWRRQGDCRRYDRVGCWRIDGQVTLCGLAQGSALALVWPVAVFAALIWFFAARGMRPAVDPRRIADLERELGIDQ